jgi:hypothetical protein
MHVKSLLHVRDHSKATGPAHHLLEYIALHVNAYTGEAFELTVDRLAHRLHISAQWVGQLRRQLVETGELIVKQSRGRRPNVYIIPYERCPACQESNPKVADEGDDLNPKVEFGVHHTNPKVTPKQPPSNPKVAQPSRPLLARISPQKEVKVFKEKTFFPDARQPQTPLPSPPEKQGAEDQVPTPTKTTIKRRPPPIGDARRQFIEDLTSWAQEGAPGVDAPQFLDPWLYECEAHHYEWVDWAGMAKWKLREAYHALPERPPAVAMVGGTASAAPRCGVSRCPEPIGELSPYYCRQHTIHKAWEAYHTGESHENYVRAVEILGAAGELQGVGP